MQKYKQSASKRRGAALISSLMLVAAIATMGAGLVQISSVSTNRQNMTMDNTQALYVSEAGLAEAYFAVAQGRSGNIGSDSDLAQYGDGFYWVEATDLPNGVVTLEATGLYGKGRFTVGMTLNRSVNQVAALGFCGLKEVNIGEGAQITALNPAGGTPDPVNVRSNEDITILSPVFGMGVTTVEGNVIPGPNGTMDADPGTVITGVTASASRGVSLPTFNIPRLGGGTPGSYVYPMGVRELVLNSDTIYEQMDVPAGSRLVLQGPMRLRTETLNIAPGATVRIDTSGGPVGIYTTGTTTFSPGSVLENIGDDSTQCTLFALSHIRTDKPVVTMGAKGDFKGMIVAPRSTVNVPGDLQITGSVVAERLNLGDGASMRFDPDLLTEGYGVQMTPSLVAWEILEVPDTPVTRGTLPIHHYVRINGVPTTPSSRAANETNVEINYIDGMGLPQTYTGVDSGVPWGSVDSVLQVSWFDGVSFVPTPTPSIVVDAVDFGNGAVDFVANPEG